MIRNNFETKKAINDTQTLIIRGTYEEADPTTGAGIDIQWDEISIGFFVNGIWIETDMMPFINEVAGQNQVIEHGLFEIIDQICLDEIEGRNNKNRICGGLFETFGLNSHGNIRRDYDMNDAE